MREYEPPSEHDDPYWTDDLAFGEAVVVAGARSMVRLRWHQSEERIRHHDELLPLAEKTDRRAYVHARPYVLEPAISLTIGLYPRETSPGIIGEVVDLSRHGMRQRELGQAQAWYYPADKLLMLWECYLFDPVRQCDPTTDQLHAFVWRGFEQTLLARFPATERITTPSWEDLYERQAWQQFLGGEGYLPYSQGVFLKWIRPSRSA